MNEKMRKWMEREIRRETAAGIKLLKGMKGPERRLVGPAAKRPQPVGAEVFREGTTCCASSCRECGKTFDLLPDSLPASIREEFEKVDICSECAVSMLVACPHCGAARTYYDGWNCPTEGCDSLHNA
jgi:hypothetical protein